jgi:hypothetical protein
MVGIVVDAHRLNRTRGEFSTVFDLVQRLFQENLKELKGSKIIFGRDRWRNVDSEVRNQITKFFCRWVVERKHHIALAAIDRQKFKNVDGTAFPQLPSDPWLVASLHIALQIQKHHQQQKKNKGHTFLFVDENKQKADQLAELLFEPPEWTDAYYGLKKSQERLDQLIDSAFAVKSHHAGLIQVADLFALILRRYSEIHDYKFKESWECERSFIEECAKILASRLLPKATRWPERTKADCCKWYNAIAPESLLRLGS